MGTQDLIEAFRDYCGDLKFRRFVFTLRSADGSSDKRLLYWQESVLRRFREETGVVLATDFDSLVDLFRDCFPVHRLSEADAPPWCTIDSLGGFYSVQGEGSYEGHRWYFQADWGSWSFALTTLPERDPVDVIGPGDPDEFYRERLYGDGRYDASSMPVDEARSFIMQCLWEFRESAVERRFARQRFDRAEPDEAEQLCLELARVLGERITGTEDLESAVRKVVHALRTGGHDLWNFDQEEDHETWCAGWGESSAASPPSPTLTLEVRLPSWVRVTWGHAKNQVAAEIDAFDDESLDLTD